MVRIDRSTRMTNVFQSNRLGPFRFMDTYGVDKIVEMMNQFRGKYGDRFAPTQLLVDMAKDNKKFYS